MICGEDNSKQKYGPDEGGAKFVVGSQPQQEPSAFTDP